MTRAQALTKLKKMYGKKAYATINQKAPTTSKREEAAELLPALRARRDSLRASLESRRVYVLGQDVEYQTLLSQVTEARKEMDAALSVSDSYKFRVGYMELGAFHIQGEGDTWEQAFEKAEARK